MEFLSFSLFIWAVPRKLCETQRMSIIALGKGYNMFNIISNISVASIAELLITGYTGCLMMIAHWNVSGSKAIRIWEILMVVIFLIHIK